MDIKPMTKWELLSAAERTRLEQQKFGGCCSGCGTPLETEGDFAKHFILYDSRFVNLGYCPEKGID